VVARLNGHLHAGLLPPVEPWPHREDDALLGRRVVRPSGDDEARSAHPILVELLDHDLIEQRPQLMPNRLNGLPSRTRFHGEEDNHDVATNSARIWHVEALFGEGEEGRVPAMPERVNPAPGAERRFCSPGVHKLDGEPAAASRTHVWERPDVAVARLASEDWGVLSLDELRRCGLSRGTVATRVRRGWLHPVYRSVYAVGHPQLSLEGRFMAAVKAFAGDAVLSHFSAAALWGFLDWDNRTPEVTVVQTGARICRGIRAHRTSLLEPRDVMRHEGIPVTSPARTLVDLAAVVNEKLLRSAVRRALAKHRVSIRQVAATRRRLGRRRGSVNLSRVLRAAAPTRSELEDVVFDLVVDSGFACPDVNRPLLLAGRRVIPDFRWPEQRVVVEADSRTWHDNAIARQDDAQRQALLEACGERVLRVTWNQAIRSPSETVRRIEAAGVPRCSPASRRAST